ncbi:MULTISPECIES: hypothetical protein [unclassified Microbacterium]|uniref:hypothetical protein n=1 Tax=unclassified Microbacterium TaxID=2609290 RepID=UPI000EAAB726|nr:MULTISPECIES: hypothetical protein [unclassified Microbacterium]MBT2485134.1 hypothetical protein [Microbacterium sp. ISL-108]RKN67973.1 hypothetical protein D7252_10470 [Microbacterium sp. CGR2]
MDPSLLVEWWWIAPSAIAMGTVGVIGMNRRSTAGGRRLAYDAARHDLSVARQAAIEKRTALRIARADLARVSAERAAHRATAEQVAGARRMLRDRERDARAATAEVRARQIRLNAARAAIPSASAPRPLDRLHAEHDAIIARWMRYETDTALQITYPAMTDVRQPATAAYLRAAGHAVDTRRAADGRITAAEFAAYRDAVAELERAFEAAEHAAKVQAGEVPPSAAAWQETAQDMLTRSAEAIDRAAGAAASALSAWSNRKRPGKPGDPDR